MLERVYFTYIESLFLRDPRVWLVRLTSDMKCIYHETDQRRIFGEVQSVFSAIDVLLQMCERAILEHTRILYVQFNFAG